MLLCGSFANAFGNGVVFPFFLIDLRVGIRHTPYTPPPPPQTVAEVL